MATAILPVAIATGGTARVRARGGQASFTGLSSVSFLTTRTGNVPDARKTDSFLLCRIRISCRKETHQGRHGTRAELPVRPSPQPASHDRH